VVSRRTRETLATSLRGVSVTDIVRRVTGKPLTPAVFHILLALSRGELHGYGIMKQVESDSRRRVRMGAGTLYGSLRRMLDAGLIRESGKRLDPAGDDERRIYYAISGEGRKALASELARYQHLVDLAREKRLLATRPAYVR
jgi:DNA-binding PadR family transcriptional regulator